MKDRVESIRALLTTKFSDGGYHSWHRADVEFLLDENTRALTLIDKLQAVATAARNGIDTFATAISMWQAEFGVAEGEFDDEWALEKALRAALDNLNPKEAS